MRTRMIRCTSMEKVDEPYLDEFKKALTDGQPLTGDFSLKKKYQQIATLF